VTKPTIGLTGGIACGKSTVARLFTDLGIPIVDADQLARDVVAPGSEGLAEIVREFGDEVLTDDGSLDRKKLGGVVFSDTDARRRLEAITHPRIAQLGMQTLAELSSTSEAPYLMYEAALLVEGGMHKAFPALVVVSAAAETQLARLRARDASSEQEARARIDSQLPVADKVAVADFVIQNDGTIEQTRAQVEQTHEALVRRLSGG
jgi:dephospho-CoA kinase